MNIFKFFSGVLVLVLLSSPVPAYSKGSRGGHSRVHSHPRGHSHSRGHSLSNKSHSRSVRVKGYTKKNGTYVSAHHRTRPNRSKRDNWSTKGNINPYTGKEGTKDPDN